MTETNQTPMIYLQQSVLHFVVLVHPVRAALMEWVCFSCYKNDID